MARKRQPRRSRQGRLECPAWTAYQALCDEAERDYEGYWARLARELIALDEAVHARRSTRANAPFYQVVRGRHAERLLQLPRPPRRARPAATRPRSSSRPTTARSTQVSYTRAARAHLPARQRAEGARRQEGRPRRHLHADVDRGRGRDAGLRAHRRDPLGGVRRLLGAERCATASSTPARWW